MAWMKKIKENKTLAMHPEREKRFPKVQDAIWPIIAVVFFSLSFFHESMKVPQAGTGVTCSCMLRANQSGSSVQATSVGISIISAGNRHRGRTSLPFQKIPVLQGNVCLRVPRMSNQMSDIPTSEGTSEVRKTFALNIRGKHLTSLTFESTEMSI